jgi:hypothetical protein
MLNIKKSEPKYTISQLVVELLYSAPVAHIEHLKTTSFAQHKALNEYYDGIPDLTDSIIENYEYANICKIEPLCVLCDTSKHNK